MDAVNWLLCRSIVFSSCGVLPEIHDFDSVRIGIFGTVSLGTVYHAKTGSTVQCWNLDDTLNNRSYRSRDCLPHLYAMLQKINRTCGYLHLTLKQLPQINIPGIFIYSLVPRLDDRSYDTIFMAIHCFWYFQFSHFRQE